MSNRMLSNALYEQFNQDWCCICPHDATRTDALGLPWCKEHDYRGKFLTWGLVHGFPSLEALPFAVGMGAYAWYIAATLGSDDYVWTLIAAIEALYDEEVAA